MKNLITIILSLFISFNCLSQNLSVVLNGISPIDCYSNYGEIWSSVTGGTSPYNYVWSTGATTSYIQYLTQGTYSVTVTDASFNTATASFTITELPYFHGTMYYFAPTPGNCDGGMLLDFYHTDLVNYLFTSYPFDIYSSGYGGIGYKMCQYENPITVDVQVGSNGPGCPWQYNGLVINPATHYAGPYSIQTTVNQIDNCFSDVEIKIANPHKIDPYSMPAGVNLNAWYTNIEIRNIQNNNITYLYTSYQIQYLDSISFYADSLPAGDYIFNYTDGVVLYSTYDTLGIHLSDTFSLPGTPQPTAYVTPSGNTLLCDGNTIDLVANTGSGLTYQWQLNGNNITGATSSVYTASAAGTYRVIVSNSCGSKTSNNINITTGNSPNATLTVSGDTSICSGNSVSLNLIPATGQTYQWKKDGNLISSWNQPYYIATTPGEYLVSITNNCGTLTSDTIVVTSGPESPVTTNVSLCGPGTATLNASASSPIINWYDLPTGGNLLGSGNSFTTPFINTTTTYYAEAVDTTTGFYGFVPPHDSAQGGGTYVNNANYHMYFDVLQEFELISVKVYAAYNVSTTIVLYNKNGSLVYSKLVNIPQGESRVYLNWIISPDINYYITKINVPSNASLYSNNFVIYPITIPGYLTIKSPGTGISTVYFYFYDWEIDAPSQSCVSSRTPATVTVGSSVTPAITASGSTSICDGNSVQLNANTGTGLTYQWQLNGSNINSANSSSYSATLAGNYAVVVTDSCGSNTSNTITVTVNSSPNASITASGSTSICAGSSVTLNANTVTGFSYQWQLNGSNINGATSSIYSATSAGNYTVVVSNTCGSSSSNVITVTTGASPSAAITASGSTSICAGSSVTLNANTVTGLSYQWQLNGSNINGATSSIYSATSAGNYTVVVSNTCGSSTSNVITVTSGAAPSAAITASGSTSICAGSSVTLNANTGAGLSYQWLLNGNNISGANNSIYNATSSGNYSVIVSDSCGISISNIIFVNVISAPGSAGAISGPTSFCRHSTQSFSVSPVTGSTNYTWSVPQQAQIVSGQGTNSIVVSFIVKQGDITVKASNSCGSGPLSVLPVQLVKCANPNSNNPNSPLRTAFNTLIYPNPSLNDFNCEIQGEADQIFSLHVFDYSGRMVELKENIVSNSNFSFGNDLAPGFYFVEISSGDDKEIYKVVKVE